MPQGKVPTSRWDVFMFLAADTVVNGILSCGKSLAAVTANCSSGDALTRAAALETHREDMLLTFYSDGYNSGKGVQREEVVP